MELEVAPISLGVPCDRGAIGPNPQNLQIGALSPHCTHWSRSALFSSNYAVIPSEVSDILRLRIAGYISICQENHFDNIQQHFAGSSIIFCEILSICRSN